MSERIIANAIEVAYRLEGPANAPTVVLGNGLATDLSMWAPQVEMLKRSFQVLRYDMRGHGDTATTAGDYSLALLAQDALALLDKLGIGPVHFIGTSLGGMVGQYLGARHGSRLLSLTLCATSSDAPKPVWQARVEAARAHGVPPLAQATIERWFTPRFRETNTGLMAHMEAMVLRTTRDGYAGSAAAIRDMALVGMIHDIQAPTLVIAGEDDLSTPLPALERTARDIPGARLVRIAEAAHLPTMEQPERCNEAIEQFLLSLPLGEASEQQARSMPA